jgi:hypothetical protein
MYPRGCQFGCQEKSTMCCTNYPVVSDPNTAIQLVLHPVAEGDSELAEICGSIDFMVSAKPILPKLVQRLPHAADPSRPRSLLSHVSHGARCCCAWLLSASPQGTYVGCALGWVCTADPPTTASARSRAEPLTARYQARLPRRHGLRIDCDDRVANMVLPTIDA